MADSLNGVFPQALSSDYDSELNDDNSDTDDSDFLSKTATLVENSIIEEDLERAGYGKNRVTVIEESSEESEDNDVSDVSGETSEASGTDSEEDGSKSVQKPPGTEKYKLTGTSTSKNPSNGAQQGLESFSKVRGMRRILSASDDSDAEAPTKKEGLLYKDEESPVGKSHTYTNKLKPRVISDESESEPESKPSHRSRVPVIQTDSSEDEDQFIESSSENDIASTQAEIQKSGISATPKSTTVKSPASRSTNKLKSTVQKKSDHKLEGETTPFHRPHVPVIQSDSSADEDQIIESDSEDDIPSVKANSETIGVTQRNPTLVESLSNVHIDLTESTDEEENSKKTIPPSDNKTQRSVSPDPLLFRGEARRVQPPITSRQDASSLLVKTETATSAIPLNVPKFVSARQVVPTLTGYTSGGPSNIVQGAVMKDMGGSAQTASHQDFYKMSFENEKRSLELKINSRRNELAQTKRAVATVNFKDLPDQGSKILARQAFQENELRNLEIQLARLNPQNAASEAHSFYGRQPEPLKPPSASWKNLKNTNDIQHGFGVRAMENHLAEKALTLDALHILHSSIKTCPGEEVLSEDPMNLRSSVELMPHQKHALAWLTWREQQKPPGGILADDMGLGKTLTMISLVLKSMEDDQDNDSEDSNEDDRENWLSKSKHKNVKGGTLVICPASLLSQWEGEVKQRVKSGILDVEIHHGPSREKKPHRLARRDIVITTYAIVRTEADNKGALHQVKWDRIILDEAHVVRNYKSKTSVAVVDLKGKHRWALTGTPIHNKELDLFALIKFLRCAPFDELTVWRRWVDNKRENGMQRLNTVMNSLMLRRTKEQLQEKKALNCLPVKELHEVDVKLTAPEMAVYEKILEYSRNLFSQFLHQRAEKEASSNGLNIPYMPVNFKNMKQSENPFDPNSKLGVLVNKFTRMEDVKSHQILVLLLRLRQICCHPGLITAMLDEEEQDSEGIEDKSGLDIDLVDQIGKMNLGSGDDEKQDEKPVEEDVIDDAVKILSVKNEVFNMDRVSSKIAAVFKVLEETVLSTSDKAVVVSQWASMLHIMRDQLKAKGVKLVMLTGAIPVKDRMPIIDKFNQKDRGPQVMLLSLTAGGVGLNLIGGNHLFLCDLHWNPQLEAQACDRIYRVGQKKSVHIYKFVCEGTIEQRIKTLQEQKMQLATNVLTGARNTSANKLTMNDLKMLFEIT